MTRPDRVRTFLDPPRPVRLAWSVTSGQVEGAALVARCRTERFEPNLEWLTGTHAEMAWEAPSRPGEATLRLEAWSDDILRIRYTRGGRLLPVETLLIAGDPPGPSRCEVTEQTDELVLATATLRARLTRDPLRLVVEDAAGKPVVATRAPDLPSFEGQAGLWDRTAQRWLYLNRHAYPLGCTDGDSAGDGTGGADSMFLSLELPPDERIYGFGESFDRLEKTGSERRLWTQEAFTNASPSVYKPVPFFMSTAGYGLFVNTTNGVVVHVGDLDPTAISVIVADAAVLDLFVIHGPTPAEVLRRYASLTGPPGLPPKWSFGLWLSRCSYEGQPEVEAVAQEVRRRRIPADVIHVDTAWFEKDWVCDWRFGSRFPDPAGMLRRLAEMGLHVSLWQWPYVAVDSPAFVDALEAGVLVHRRGGDVYVLPGGNTADVAVIDYSDPRAAAWIEERLRPLFEMGVAAIKLDFGEGAPIDGVYAGIAASAAHNAYPLLYAKAIWDATERARGPGEAVVWARAGWAGSQRYPVHWSGDGLARFEDLACVLRAALSMGLSGFPFYSHDIGGFMGVPTPELYVRWAQLGLLSSHARMHGLGPREPWAFGEEAEAIVRRSVELRYRLMPYIWTEAQEAAASGLPMVRALVLDDPDDANVAFIDDEFLFGRDILVAPILDARDHRRVYLPRGRWVELGSGTAHPGGRWIEAHAPLDRVPLYVRAGSVLPMGPLMQHVDELPLDPLQLWIHEPAASGGYRVREASGDIVVGYRLDRDALTVEVAGAPGAVEVLVPGRSSHLLDRTRRGATDVLTLGLGDPEA